MKITISGTQEQVTDFVKALLSKKDASSIFNKMIDEELLETEYEADDPAIYEVFEDIAWPTFHLAHIIYEHHTLKKIDLGLGMTVEELLDHEIDDDETTLSKRELSSRLGGAKKVTKRLGTPDVFIIRRGKKRGEKRYYLSEEVIPTFEQYLQDQDENYREYLEENDYFYPGDLEALEALSDLVEAD